MWLSASVAWSRPPCTTWAKKISDWSCTRCS
jgi:hypothetical protein